jgi:hypothetical protein
MYTHEHLQDFGKICASKVTPAITNQQIDYKKLANQFAESILNRPDHSIGAYDNGPTGEDVVKVLQNHFYGGKVKILDYLLEAFKVLDGWDPKVSGAFVTAVFNYEKEKCKDPEYFVKTYTTITSKEHEQPYKDATVQRIATAIKEYFGSLHPKTDVRDLIRNGYQYRFSSQGDGKTTRSTMMFTNSNGARLYVDTCRRNELPDWIISQNLEVNLGGIWTRISEIQLTGPHK